MTSLNKVLMSLYGHKSNPSVQQLVLTDKQIRNTLLINGKIALLTKHGSEKNSVGEYQFTFNTETIDQLVQINLCFKVRIALVCEDDDRVCEFDLQKLLDIRNARLKSMNGFLESQLSVLVTIDNKNCFTAYANEGNKKGKVVGAFTKKSGLFTREFCRLIA